METPEETAALAWLAEPEIERAIKEAVRQRFDLKLLVIAANEQTSLAQKDRLPDMAEAGVLRLMAHVMAMAARTHIQGGRAAAEEYLAFVLPLVSSAEVPVLMERKRGEVGHTRTKREHPRG